MKAIHSALQVVYRQLYTNFAWTYDAVAAAVSLGEWKAWGRAAIQFIDAPAPLLEVAYGPGHLHLALRQMGYRAVGVDLSAQMSAMAAMRLARAGYSNTLARADVYRLPFPDAAFGGLVSTFPAGFIFDPLMLREAWRVLAPAGRLVVVPSVILRTTNPAAIALMAYQRLTRLDAMEALAARNRIEQAGFAFSEHRVPARRADAVVWVGVKQKLPIRIARRIHYGVQ